MLKFERSCQFFLYPKFQLVTVKYHEVVKYFFVKCPAILKQIVSVHTKCQYQVTVLGTDPVLEIGPILQHLKFKLNSRNFINFLTRKRAVTPPF